MSNENLQTKKPSPTDIIEERSRLMLRSKLPLNEASISYPGDKYPNWDGILEFFNNSEFVTKLFFQLKGTQEDANFYDTEIAFLNYCYKAYEPHFLILANIPGNKVYWEHIDKAYIENVLGIKDLTKFDQQTKRINFSETNVIEQNSPILIEICKKHYADNAKHFVPAMETPAIIIPSEGELMPFEEVKKKFGTTTEGLEDKLMLYHSFVYALRPFYLDRRGENKRKKLLSYLRITDAEERFIIEKFTDGHLIERVGDLISVNNRQEAISTLNHFVETGNVDLEQITNLFSNAEN